MIVSDANLFFIETVLKHHGLINYFSEINTNPSLVDEDGKLRIFLYHDFTCAPHGCDLCPPNMCKDNFSRLHEGSKEIQKTAKQLSKLFPNKVAIQLPQDENLLSDWKEQLDRDVETLRAKTNILNICSVLSRNGLECHELETLCIKDEALSNESVEKILGWALSYQLMQNTEVSAKDSKIVVSVESIKYGLNILQGIQSETNILKKLVKDVVTENEFENRLLADVIPPSDRGVTFEDIGALENVKDTLKELAMLPLQRPELFCRGQLTKDNSKLQCLGWP